jgi:mRNA guanylyltransferase
MVTSGVYKEKLASFDMATNHDHDIRVDVMKETPITPLPHTPEEGYIYERKKKRFTIETKDWQLDLLDVVTNTDTKSYEIEAQIKINSIRNAPDKKTCVDLFDNVFVEVHNLLARLSKNGAQVFPDLKLEMVTRSEHYQYLKTQFLQVVPNVSAHNHRFPGSLPSGLERSKIKHLQKGDYWVSEKSDGLRYLLFIVDRGAYLIDRRMDFYQIHKFPLLIDLFGSTDGVTLLDGEMVRNLRTGKLMFLIFDILALNGQTNIGMYNLSERLSIIGKKVVTVFRDAIKEKGKDYFMKLQFTLSGKIFRPKHLIKELATMIKHNEKGERLFVDDKRCHRNDGLIFTPSGPYLVYSSSHLMKWKYCDRLTIDFLFKFTDEGHVALVGQGGDVMVNWPDFDMLPHDWDKLTSALATTRDPSKAVIECAFNNETQKWMFLCLRPDKDRPNHIKTVQHTLFIVNENITLEELVHRVPLKTEDDDWEETHPEMLGHDLPDDMNSSSEDSSNTCSSQSSEVDSQEDAEEEGGEEGENDIHEESPTVDLPTSPLPSPIVSKSTPEAYSPEAYETSP